MKLKLKGTAKATIKKIRNFSIAIQILLSMFSIILFLLPLIIFLAITASIIGMTGGLTGGEGKNEEEILLEQKIYNEQFFTNIEQGEPMGSPVTTRFNIRSDDETNTIINHQKSSDRCSEGKCYHSSSVDMPQLRYEVEGFDQAYFKTEKVCSYGGLLKGGGRQHSCNWQVPVYATMSGDIVKAGRNGDWGNSVLIRNGNRYIRVAHMYSIAKGIKPGVKVGYGTLLGIMGNTGNSYGSHVHYDAGSKDGPGLSTFSSWFPGGVKAYNVEGYQRSIEAISGSTRVNKKNNITEVDHVGTNVMDVLVNKFTNFIKSNIPFNNGATQDFIGDLEKQLRRKGIDETVIYTVLIREGRDPKKLIVKSGGKSVEEYNGKLDTETPSSLQVYVTSDKPLNNIKYEPKNLKYVKSEYVQDVGKSTVMLRSDANSAFQKLAEKFKKDMGYKLEAYSGYRDYQHQLRIEKGREKGGCSKFYCASAGYSEHQTGLGIDIVDASDENDWKTDPKKAKIFDWMKKNAHNYGFNNSYQRGVEIDGYHIEPWHWRYLGNDLAKFLKENDLSYGEYFTKKRESRPEIVTNHIAKQKPNCEKLKSSGKVKIENDYDMNLCITLTYNGYNFDVGEKAINAFNNDLRNMREDIKKSNDEHFNSCKSKVSESACKYGYQFAYVWVEIKENKKNGFKLKKVK